MKNLLKLSAFALLLSIVLFSCSKEEAIKTNDELSALQNGDVIPGKYIITLKQDNFKSVNIAKDYAKQQEIMVVEVKALLKDINIVDAEIDHVYTNALFGFAANLSQSDLETIKKDPRVVGVEPDRMIILGKPTGGGTTPAAEEKPYGITRVNGGVSGATGKAWVIDSGIDLDHPDLNVDVANSKSFLGGTTTPDDQNGHGTHVAGTIAAIDNTQGVIGVAAGAKVVAVRVLDRRGSGSNSGVIAGIDYVGANGKPGDVANMSLGGGVSTTLDAAVVNAAKNSGVIFCLASGNESDDALNHSPARANGTNVYTISAMDNLDKWAYFSNYGTPVDYCAPGVNIKSTWLNGGYNTISGTSMATPHAAGVFLLGAAHTSGSVIGDPDGNPDPIIVH